MVNFIMLALLEGTASTHGTSLYHRYYNAYRSEFSHQTEASTVSDLGSTAHLGTTLLLTYLILNYFLNNCSYYYTASGGLQGHVRCILLVSRVLHIFSNLIFMGLFHCTIMSICHQLL